MWKSIDINNYCIEIWDKSNKISLDYVLTYKLTIKYKLRPVDEQCLKATCCEMLGIEGVIVMWIITIRSK